MDCAACGAAESDLRLSLGGFRFVTCCGCGLTRTESKVAQATAPAGYATGDAYLETYHRHYLAPRTASFRRWLPELERFRESGRLLEIGSGPGYFLREAASAGWQPTGLELSAREVRHAREELEVDAIQGTLQENAPAEPVDLVVAWDALEHLPNPKGALTCIARVLRPGGGLFLKVPDGGVFDFRPAGWLDRRLFRVYLRRVFPLNPGEHLFHFSEPVLRALFEEAGLVVERVERSESKDEIAIVSPNAIKAAAKRFLFRTALRHAWPHVLHVIARKP